MRTVQNSAVNNLFPVGATDEIYSKLSRTTFNAVDTFPGAVAPTQAQMDALLRSRTRLWAENLSREITNHTQSYVSDAMSARGIPLSSSELAFGPGGTTRNYLKGSVNGVPTYIEYKHVPIKTTVTSYGTTSEVISSWTVTAKLDDSSIKSLINGGTTTFASHGTMRKLVGKEVMERTLAEVAEKSRKLNWGQGIKKAAANLLSWQTVRTMGWGVGCGIVSNLAGMGAWKWYWGKNYTDPNELANIVTQTTSGNGIDDDEDGEIDEETCDGINNDPQNDDLIDEDCGNILQRTIKKYSTYRLDIEQSISNGRRSINIREITSEADIQTMKEDLANGSATRMDEKYCNGEFMEKSIQIVFGSLSPPDSEPARKIVYYTPAIQEPVVNMAIRYKDKGITEAMLMAIVFESVPSLDNLSASQFETKIGVVAGELEQLRVSHPTDDEALLRAYAQNNGINAGTLVTTFNKWSSYKIDWEGAYDSGSAGSGRTTPVLTPIAGWTTPTEPCDMPERNNKPQWDIFNHPADTQYYRAGFYPNRRDSAHRGMDIYAPNGTTVRAIADGQVLRTSREWVYVKHPLPSGVSVTSIKGIADQGFIVVAYGHISPKISAGATVTKGQKIAEVNYSVPHVHLEIYNREITEAAPSSKIDGSNCCANRTEDDYLVNPITIIGTYSQRCGQSAVNLSGDCTVVGGQALDFRLAGTPCISSSKIENELCNNNSPACGKASFIYNKGIEYGIKPAIALAFYKKESGFGTASKAVVTKSFGNLRYHSGCEAEHDGFCSYSTYEAGIEDWYDLIKNSNYYFKAGKYTAETIIPVYAPSSENNTQGYIRDVRNMVSNWWAIA